MSEHKYTLVLVTDDGLIDALKRGDGASVDKAISAANEKYQMTTELPIPLDLLDGVSRVSWSTEASFKNGRFRIAGPDSCETGATRVADLLDDPRKLARGIARLLEEESEVELDDDDIVVLTEFLSDNDLEADAAADSAPESVGLNLIQIAQAFQDAADHNAWLLAVCVDG